MNKKGKCIIISAPSGAGKTTIVHHLLKIFPELEFSVSATSRPRRANEQNGKDYYFLSPEEFKKRIENNEFIEWEEVYPNQYYGTLKSEIERIWNEGKHVIFDVDVVGGLNLKKIFKDRALAIFIMPPSMEVLEERLRQRKTEAEEKIKMRLNKAKEEIAKAKEFDKIVVNDNLSHAVADAEKFIRNFLNE
ncbi:MAG: guanylate kinase [Bacteroidetes bacterium]|nr:MAG: guanylate kinase [Bacteroidota bacterium]